MPWRRSAGACLTGVDAIGVAAVDQIRRQDCDGQAVAAVVWRARPGEFRNQLPGSGDDLMLAKGLYPTGVQSRKRVGPAEAD